jgi:isocitrate dehydrogenase
MLVHINLPEAAEHVHNGWLRTIEDGIHTYDIYAEGVSTQKVGTKEFADAVIARLGKKPDRLKPVRYAKRTGGVAQYTFAGTQPQTELKGVDVFVYWPSRNPNELAAAMAKTPAGGLKLQMIDNRGVKVWPAGMAETFCIDNFRCRFVAEGAADMGQIIAVLKNIADAGIEIAATQTLRNFDGKAGFTLAQGQ